MLKKAQQGITLIEMLIGLAIVALLLSAAAPSYSVYLQNQRLRAVALSLFTGLQLARAEAVQRNSRVELVFTKNDPVAPAVGSLTADAEGRNWVVRQYDALTSSYQFIEGHDGNSGAGSADATPIKVQASHATIAFNGLGASTLAGVASFQVSNPSLGLCTPAGLTRCLNVIVSSGGQVRLCDPESSLSARDTRRC